MSPEAQRIAIAEACGWRIARAGREWFSPNASAAKPVAVCFSKLPKYLTDLNAMHDAESEMNDEQQECYLLYLGRCVSAGLDDLQHDWNVVHATAAQRARAFLCAVDKWDDTK